MTIYLICIILTINVCENIKLYKYEKEIKKSIEKNTEKLKEKIETSKHLNYNIELAIEEGKNIKDININELTESVARNISNALKNQIEGR